MKMFVPTDLGVINLDARKGDPFLRVIKYKRLLRKRRKVKAKQKTQKANVGIN